MLVSLDKAIPGGDTAPEPLDATPLQIKINPADAILGSPSPQGAGETSGRRKNTRFRGFLRYTVGAAVVGCLCLLAWTAGAYYLAGHPPFYFVNAQQSLAHNDTESMIRQLADQIRALKASVDEARDADGKSGEGHDRIDTVQTKADALSDLTGRVDKLETALTTQLSKINEQLAGIEQKISEPHAVSASRAQSSPRHAEKYHDAFDPSRDPTAPGAPRPLSAY